MNYLVFAMEGEEWELNHKITVDYINKHLVVAARVVDLDIKTDVYSDYKEWFKLRDNSGYGTEAIRTIGGDPTVSGEFAGDIYFLKNGWRLVYNPRKVKIVGALFSDDYDTAYLDRSTLEEVFPAKVASIVTQIQADLSDLGIPSATQIATQVRTELSTELAQITNVDTNVIAMQSKQIILEKVLRNKTITDKGTGVMTVYDDDGVSVLFTAPIYEGVDVSTPYSGNAVNRRDRLA